MADRLQITIDGNSLPLQKALESAERRLDTFNSRVTNSSRNLTRLMGTMKGMNTSFATMISAANSAAASLNRAASAADRYAQKNHAATSSNHANRGSVLALNGSFRNLILTIYSVRTLMFTGEALFGGVLGSVLKINAAYEKQQILLENLSQSRDEATRKAEAQKNTQFIWKMADNAPFDIDALQDTFIKLKVNGIDPTNGSMQTLLDTVAAFGGTSNNLKLATLAISQMSSKGVVSMEELRRQLGEQVPTAIRAMAAGLGYIDDIYSKDTNGLRKFFKEIEKGAVDSPKAIAAMMQVFEKEYKGSAERMMNTWDGQMTRMQSAFKRMIIRVTQSSGDNSLFVTLKREIERFTKFLDSQEGDKFIKEFQNAISNLVIVISNAAQFIWKYRQEIIFLAKAFVGLFVLKQVVSLYQGFNSVLMSGITILKRVQDVKDGARLVTLLFGKEVRKAAGELSLFNSAGAVSRARVLALVAPFAAVAAVATLAAGAFYLYHRNLKVTGHATEESARHLREAKDRQEDLTQAIDSTRIASEQERLQFIRTTTATRNQTAELIRQAHARTLIAQTQLKYAEDELNAKRNQLKNPAMATGSMTAGAPMSELMYTKEERQAHANALATYNEEARALKTQIETWKKLGVEIETAKSKDFSLPELSDAGDDKKKRDPLGDLDGSRSELVNLMMQVKRLQAELGGEKTMNFFEDNAEAIELQTRAEVQAIKSQEELNSQIVHQRGLLPGLRGQLRDYAETLKLVNKEKEQLKDLENEVKDQTLKANDAVAQLDASYNSINSQVERYVNKLKEQNKEVLEITDDSSLDEKLRAETALLEIDNAAREERIRLLAKEALAAQEKSKDIEAEFMTESELRDRDYQEQVAYVEGLIFENQRLWGPQGQQIAEEYYRLLENLRRRYEVQKNPFGKWAMENKDLGKGIGDALTSSMDGFVDQLAQGKLAFKSFAKSLLSDLMKVIIRALIAKAILSALGLGGGPIQIDNGPIQGLDAGGVMSFAPSINHKGGIAGKGSGGISKNVPMGIFAGAQRFHTGGFPGLKPNEVPIIAEKGEGVFTKDQMKALGGAKASAQSAPQINIINQTGTQVDKQQTAPRFDGEKFVVDVILKKANQPGPIRELLKGGK